MDAPRRRAFALHRRKAAAMNYKADINLRFANSLFLAQSV